MPERRKVLRIAVLAGAAAAVSMGAISCRTSPIDNAVAQAQLLEAALNSIQECPHSWRAIYDRKLSARRKEPLAMAGPAGPGEGIAGVERITDIPEFHDCQRLLQPNGQYGPLIAIFAARDLDSLHLREEQPEHIAPVRGVSRVRHIGAVILNLGSTFQYEDFEIRRGFNCLYMWRRGRWEAMIVPVASDSACLKPIDPALATGTMLKVLEDRAAGGGHTDYPPVARWDADAAGRPYIGIKCGAAWCELGGASFTPNPPYEDLLATPDVRRVRRIKGWYDEQRLAVPGAAGGLVPGSLKGTLIPDPQLDRYVLVDFNSRWAPVAHIALDGNGPEAYQHYWTKLGLERAPVGAPLQNLNRIEMCRGTTADCGIRVADYPACVNPGSVSPTAFRWWTRLTAPSGATRYHCVAYIGHKGVRIPGTARWRWILDDETSWTRCVEGCCEMDNRPDVS